MEDYATEHDFDDVELYDKAERRDWESQVYKRVDAEDAAEVDGPPDYGDWGEDDPDDWPPLDEPDPFQCERCGGFNVEKVEWDLGRDSATGYHDAGIGGHCTDCGYRWEV